MSRRQLFLIAYDIVCHRRRARVLRAIRAHGLGGQKSAHECALTGRERRELEAAIRRLMDEKADRLLILRLDPRSTIETLGTATPPDHSWFYVG